jgi:hypothetical protein
MRVTRPEHELLDSLAQSARRITQENEEAVNSLIKKNLAWLSAVDDGLIKISPEGFQGPVESGGFSHPAHGHIAGRNQTVPDGKRT